MHKSFSFNFNICKTFVVNSSGFHHHHINYFDINHSNAVSRISAENERYMEERWERKLIGIRLHARLSILTFAIQLSNVAWFAIAGIQEDPVIHSMGLKLECNTRRFVTDDRRELQYRVEVQNRVYRKEMANLDAEIAKLEKMLENRSSSTSSSQISMIPHIKVISLVKISWFNLKKASFTARDYHRWGFWR